MFKSIWLTVSGVLIALALVGATPAVALHVESCMKVGAECKTATVGTTYQTVSKEYVVEEKEKVIDKCELNTTHEVKDATSEGEKDPLEVITTKAVFSKCTESALTATGLPWKLTTNKTAYEKSQDVAINGYGFSGFFCDWVQSAPGDLMFENLATRLVTGHAVGLGGCSLFLISVRHTLAMAGVSDPNLAGAVDVVVK
jgi:hypothetical protein